MCVWGGGIGASKRAAAAAAAAWLQTRTHSSPTHIRHTHPKQVMPKQRGKLTKERTLQKLVKEVDIMTRMQDCANVVRLLGLYETGGEVMLVTELCVGGDLQKLSDVSCFFVVMMMMMFVLPPWRRGGGPLRAIPLLADVAR